ncbi:hypothetical protein HETIRDRAFT_101911 [Heterobasidion irregulare TC 32-1]|uniref:Uncharacterized protein n=1 Tax=Heterobasidion irregulare (strain TC 32-1) TaxID=747525 RepID=W4K4U6_HETIT|nr:uncharacterized protein HETIRDRAFT_101911 [Heterobasidion irregulare TC 32-1]ETW80822.1 hypothetical protein HETIRDRAFT_101911 [Heterobasidion irregulare TC 32-1]
MDTNEEHRLTTLREELARARSQLDAERTQRALDEAAAREQSDRDAADRHRAMMEQMNDLTTLLRGQRDELTSHRERMEDSIVEDSRRTAEKDARLAALESDLSRIRRDQATESTRLEEARAAAATKPSDGARWQAVETVLQEIRQRSDEHREMINDFSHQMREESARRHEQLQQMLLSSASARESVSFSDPGSVQ